MDYAALFLAGTAGLVIGSGIAWAAGKAALQRRSVRSDQMMADRDEIFLALRFLRANAFITNSRGHRVRYINATPAERARAEGC